MLLSYFVLILFPCMCILTFQFCYCSQWICFHLSCPWRWNIVDMWDLLVMIITTCYLHRNISHGYWNTLHSPGLILKIGWLVVNIFLLRLQTFFCLWRGVTAIFQHLPWLINPSDLSHTFRDKYSYIMQKTQSLPSLCVLSLILKNTYCHWLPVTH